MPPVVAAAVIGAGATVYSQAQSAKSQSRATAAQQKLAEPGLTAQQYALPQLQALISSQLIPQAGRESPLLATAHRQNVEEIGETTQNQRKAAAFNWGRSGNIGRARGEIFRAGMTGSKALAKENLSYGQSQEAFKAESIAKPINALLALSGQGGQSLGIASNAITQENAYKQDMYGDIAGLGGKLFDWALENWNKKKAPAETTKVPKDTKSQMNWAKGSGLF